MSKRAWSVSVTAASAGLGMVLAVGITAAQRSPPPQETPPAPVVRASHPPTAIPASERLQALQQLRPGGQTYDIATETRGKPITIGGKVVQLPPDAYVEAVVTHGLCPVGDTCPETPAYIIVRGQSRASVAINSGRINGESVAPGETEAFTFLREALR